MEAARWVLRNDRGLTGAEQDAFSDWLAADRRHVAEFARHRKLWRRLDQVGDWEPAGGGVPHRNSLAAQRAVGSRQWLVIALAVAALVTLGALFQPA